MNYGHTIGHAMETVSDFQMEHGRAVAIGMVAAAKIANRMGMLDKGELIRLKNIIEKVGLPTAMPNLKIEDIIQAMKHDKKVSQDKIRFVLLKSIGSAFFTDEVSINFLEQVLSSHD